MPMIAENRTKPIYAFISLLVYRLMKVIIAALLVLHMSGCGTPPVNSNTKWKNDTVSKRDSLELAMLLDKAWNWKDKNADSCRLYASKALLFSTDRHIPYGQAEAYCRFGNLEEASGNNQKAANYYLQALYFDSLAGNRHGIARESNQLSVIFKKTGKLELAEFYVKKAISNWQSIKGKENSLGIAFINSGNILMWKGQLDSALFFYQRSLAISMQTGSFSLKTDGLNSIGQVYEKQKHFKRAANVYHEAYSLAEMDNKGLAAALAANNMGNAYLGLKNLDSALWWYRKSIDLKEKNNYPAGIGGTLTNIGLIYAAKGDYILALEYHNRSYMLQKTNGEEQESAISANNIGTVLKRMGKYEEAMHYFKEAYGITQRIGAKLIEIDILKNLSETAAITGDYSYAFDCTQKLQAMRDTIDRTMQEAVEKDALSHEEQTKRILLEKEKEKQRAEFDRKETESKSRQITLFSLLIVTALIALLLLAFWRVNREKHRRLIVVQQDKINRQQTDELIRNQENTILRSMFEAQEKERQRIAGDLHDRLGLKLSTARLYYSMFTKHLNALDEEEQKQFSNGNQILDEVCDELRKVAHNLASGELMRFGLVQAVNRLCETLMQASNLKISCYNSGVDDRLDSHTELQLYLVVQELLTNVFRHAKATEVTLQFSRYNNTLNIIVEDNGIGFPADKITHSAGIGLKSIQERITKLNGTLQIDSVKGRGTTISIDITLT